MIIDGTNGLIQQYDYQTPTTGFSYTFAAGTTTLVMNPAGTLATGTIIMPAAPADGMSITFSSSQQITALTLNGNTGQTVNGGVTFLPAKAAVSYVYRLASTSWWPIATVPGTGSQLQLLQSTPVAYSSFTTTTYNDFLNIPSWVKRMTVMFNGVSISGTSDIIIQLGAGSVDSTSTYVGARVAFSAANTLGTASSPTGISVYGFNAGTDACSGIATISLMGSNTWSATGTLGASAPRGMTFGFSKALSGTLDRIRITTINGTDTFDAGSVNVLYE